MNKDTDNIVYLNKEAFKTRTSDSEPKILNALGYSELLDAAMLVSLDPADQECACHTVATIKLFELEDKNELGGTVDIGSIPVITCRVVAKTEAVLPQIQDGSIFDAIAPHLKKAMRDHILSKITGIVEDISSHIDSLDSDSSSEPISTPTSPFVPKIIH